MPPAGNGRAAAICLRICCRKAAVTMDAVVRTWNCCTPPGSRVGRAWRTATEDVVACRLRAQTETNGRPVAPVSW